MEKKIGLLDFGYFNSDVNNSIELLNFTFDFVKQLEEMNFSRYWMVEHYNDYCTWTNPEILLTVLAGMTERINIGAAGTLIYFHSPYRVANTFKMLSTLFPGRIDLGLARGDTHPHMVKHLVGTQKLSNRVYKENESRLLNYLFDHKLYDHKDRMIPMPPYGGSKPTIWSGCKKHTEKTLFIAAKTAFLIAGTQKNLIFMVCGYSGDVNPLPEILTPLAGSFVHRTDELTILPFFS